MNRLLLFFVLSALTACKKDKDNSNSLVGKWKLVEIYQGYPTGCMCWAQMGSQTDVLEFTITGRYEIKKPPIASSTGCWGNYRLANDSTLMLTHECTQDPNTEVSHKFSRSLNEIIIDYQRPDGVFRYKYRRVKFM